MNDVILSSLRESAKALESLLASKPTIAAIEQAGKALADCFNKNGHVYSAGNGGSMCDAMHFAEELSGRYRDNRRGLGAQAISDAGFLSCTANDFGYEFVFSRFLEAQARNGDIFVGFSTSGKSKNVITAAKTAKTMGLKTIMFTGRPGSELSQYADIEICTPGGNYADRVQELHIKVVHILIELVERQMFPENYTNPIT